MVESKETCTSFYNIASPRMTVFLPRTISVDILRYHGVEVCPKWPDKEPRTCNRASYIPPRGLMHFDRGI